MLSKELARIFNQSEVRMILIQSPSVFQTHTKMADDLPFKAEYAKSNRSSCKSCKDNISKDSLRLAKMVQVRRILKNILCDLDEIKRSRSQKCEIFMSTRVHSIWVA